VKVRGFHRPILVAAAMLVAGRADARQYSTERGQASAEGEARILTFDRLQGVKRLRQFTAPVGLVASLGRFTFDLGTTWASTQLLRPDGSRHSVSHVTDTQARGSYVFGRDAVVATVVLNLPTGPNNASVRDYSVIGAVSPSFLGFPVASYANGFSATGGLAGAIEAGDWSLGLAGSLRVSSRFTPYVDAAGPIEYKPGLEGRIRGGADGLIGGSRLSLGVTYSTFGDDQLGVSGGTGRGQYRPGPRWLVEAGLVVPVGNTTLGLYAWNFHRTAGDTTGSSTGNRENLAAGEISLSVPVSSWLAIEPMAMGRVSTPESGHGKMGGVGATLRFRLNDAVSLTPAARYDAGTVTGANGAKTSLHGGYLSAFVRASF
jgi:hypothetical protein